MTNSEKLRQASDSDLAVAMIRGQKQVCQLKKGCIRLAQRGGTIPWQWCWQCAMKWLQQEAKEDKQDG